MSIVDQYHDAAYGVLYQRMRDFPELLETVKSAELDPSVGAGLPDSAFAWPDERRFPIHSREHAAISYAYAKEAAEVPREVKARLEQVLDVYGVPARLYERAKVAHAPAPTRYALPDQALLPLDQLEKSAALFEEQSARLPVELRAQAAVSLVSEGAQGVKLAKYAGMVVSDTALAAEWIEARAEAAPLGMKTAYLRLADGMRRQPPESTDRAGLSKIAAALAEADRIAGLEGLYDRKLPDPMSTVFNTDKLASETVDLGGYAMPVDKLAALPVSFWEDLGGPELAREIAPNGKVAAESVGPVVETLPLDLKMVLRKQMGC
jgi:hypothetical protein